MVKMRGKFQVESVNRTEHAEQLKLRAVYGGSTNAEDNTYSAATPSGTIEMTVTNKALWGTLNPGDRFYVDFVAVPEGK